jgi:5-hydroxyisourate hydrolase
MSPTTRLAALSSHISPTMSTPKPPVTCHVLDTVRGKPAAGIACTLYRFAVRPSSDAVPATHIATGTTNSDGRVTTWNAPFQLEESATYKIRFETWDYFEGETFFPFVEVVFKVNNTGEHYHIPLLLAPWSYSTYRGS